MNRPLSFNRWLEEYDEELDALPDYVDINQQYDEYVNDWAESELDSALLNSTL